MTWEFGGNRLAFLCEGVTRECTGDIYLHFNELTHGFRSGIPPRVTIQSMNTKRS